MPTTPLSIGILKAMQELLDMLSLVDNLDEKLRDIESYVDFEDQGVAIRVLSDTINGYYWQLEDLTSHDDLSFVDELVVKFHHALDRLEAASTAAERYVIKSKFNAYLATAASDGDFRVNRAVELDFDLWNSCLPDYINDQTIADDIRDLIVPKIKWTAGIVPRLIEKIDVEGKPDQHHVHIHIYLGEKIKATA